MQRMAVRPDAGDVLGRNTLITGEVNTGKTTMTGELADLVCGAWEQTRIVVLDMAPTIPGDVRKQVGRAGISGRVGFEAMSGAAVFCGGLVPPRLMSGSPARALQLAGQNRARIDSWLEQVLCLEPLDLLVVNDISISLQAGTVDLLVQVFNRAATVIANGYMGRTLGSGRMSEFEQSRMTELACFFDNRVHLERVFG